MGGRGRRPRRLIEAYLELNRRSRRSSGATVSAGRAPARADQDFQGFGAFRISGLSKFQGFQGFRAFKVRRPCMCTHGMDRAKQPSPKGQRLDEGLGLVVEGEGCSSPQV